MGSWGSLGWAGLFVVLGVSARTYSPEPVDPRADGTYFVGFVTEPSADVHVQARRWWDGAWVTVARVQASATPYPVGPAGSPHGGRPRYQWYVNARIARSFADVRGLVTLRAEQRVARSWVPVFLYDAAGWRCFVGHRRAHPAADAREFEEWDAAVECSRSGGAERHQITFRR